VAKYLDKKKVLDWIKIAGIALVSPIYFGDIMGMHPRTFLKLILAAFVVAIILKGVL